MKKEMTNKRKQVLDFIVDFTRQNGYSPTINEIKKGTNNKSSNYIQYSLDRLEQDGYIKRAENIRVCKPIIVLKQ